ncbi:hypothetical protein SAMN04489708_109162 [Paracidovorax cattleyae]|uniref:Ferritin-like domain-containing protein n=2 Tax=Paracidovorax cattleyae TaxID=80868 RepID=A0A1H0R656_9BURK|nr:hypothetical protein [Paracidovorax cattleyae]SDP24895.1 hypothetical protein SAMN04489708_109162 [Paracidovorax cattleyae]
MEDAVERYSPPGPIDLSQGREVRLLCAQEAGPLGTVPPPTSLGSMVRTGVSKPMGEHPEILLNKFGERIVFERGGTDDVALQADASALATLPRIRAEELQHFQMLCDAMRQLGGDPTAQTPCADVVATASMGIDPGGVGPAHDAGAGAVGHADRGAHRQRGLGIADATGGAGSGQSSPRLLPRPSFQKDNP